MLTSHDLHFLAKNSLHSSSFTPQLVTILFLCLATNTALSSYFALSKAAFRQLSSSIFSPATQLVMSSYAHERRIAELAVQRAALLTDRVYNSHVKGTSMKEDKSPVTRKCPYPHDPFQVFPLSPTNTDSWII